MADTEKYFDCNATTPMSAPARDTWLEMSNRFWHNPSSLYREAGAAKLQLEDYREELADLLGLDEPGRIVFTSGATEGNNALIDFLVQTSKKPVAVSAIEHPCIQAPAQRYLETGQVREIPVNVDSGQVDLDVASAWIRQGEVSTVSVMAANNETGVLQPWLELAEICQSHGVQFHTDAAQWLGKRECVELGICDYVTGSGHKFGGGKGIGFLVLPDNDKCASFHGLLGGPQEEGRRGGTENLPGVAAMVSALKDHEASALMAEEGRRSSERNEFERLLVAELGCVVLGQKSPRLWNTSMVVLPHTKNLKWLTRLSRQGFCVSTGSACSAGSGNPSRVMAAMGLDFERMGKVIRVSGGWTTNSKDWNALAAAFAEVELELRA